MSIVLKLLVKNITGKKIRTLLILFSIVLSASVFFSSIAISGSILKTIVSSITQVVGVSDITILPTDKSDSKFLSRGGLERYSDKFEFVIGELDKTVVFNPAFGEEAVVNIKGVDLEELNQLNPFSIKSSEEIYPFQGKKIIIGEDLADKHKLEIGDVINIKIGNIMHRFNLCAIASSKGVFSKAHSVRNFVIPKQTMSSLMNAYGKENRLFIKLKDSKTKEAMVKLLATEYKNYEVKQTFNEAKLESQLTDISAIFFLLSGIVFFMSVFIIYSSFKVIALERIPIVGTLRSVGATKRHTNIILLGESLLYGTIGGILGCALGVGVLYLLSLYMSEIANVAPGLQLNTKIQYSFVHLIVTFVVSILLSFFSSIVPIIKVSKISIKDIILNTVHLPNKITRKRLLVAGIFLVVAFLITLPEYSPDDNLFLGLSMFFALLSMVFCIPYIVSFFVRVFEKVYVVVFGNVGILAAKNLRENKSVINNIIMLAIGISVLLSINTTGYNTVLSTMNSYKESQFDLRLSVLNASRNFRIKLANTDGVEKVYVDYEYDNVRVVDTDNIIGTVKGINVNEFSDFWTIDTDGDFESYARELDEGRNIIITSNLKRLLNVDKGDVLTLRTEAGAKIYKVIGFFKAFMNDSDYALVSDKFIKIDMKSGESSVYYIKTSKNPQEMLKVFKNDFKVMNSQVYTKKQLEQAEIDENLNTITLMQAFCFMAIVIGFFGVINNLVLSFIQRRQSLAMLRSVGMSKKQTVAMIFIEAFTGGIIGAISGILGGVCMIYILSKLDNSPLRLEVQSLGVSILLGVVVMVLASIGPVIKSTKLNLIESLKYD